jgi:hypothetical protein
MPDLFALVWIVAVGTEVTSRPPRRSRRAAFCFAAPSVSAPGSCRRSNAFGAWAPVPVRGRRPSGTCRFRLCVRGMRWPLPFLRPFPPHSPPPACRLALFEASPVLCGLLLSSEPASLVQASRSGPGPLWRLRATGDLPGSDTILDGSNGSQTPAEPSQNGPAHVACGGSQRLGLRDFDVFEAQYSPRRLAVYASRPPSPTTPQHSLPGGRYSLPGPDFHRLDRASFAWRTRTSSKARQKR